jgi:hypothetical protein
MGCLLRNWDLSELADEEAVCTVVERKAKNKVLAKVFLQRSFPAKTLRCDRGYDPRRLVRSSNPLAAHLRLEILMNKTVQDLARATKMRWPPSCSSAWLRA